MPDPVDVSEELAAIEERSPLLVRPGFLIRYARFTVEVDRLRKQVDAITLSFRRHKRAVERVVVCNAYAM